MSDDQHSRTPENSLSEHIFALMMVEHVYKQRQQRQAEEQANAGNQAVAAPAEADQNYQSDNKE